MTQFGADTIVAGLFPLYGTRSDNASSLWAFIFEDDGPDGYQRTTNSPSLHSTANGIREGYNVVISAQTGRIDITLTAAISDDADVSSDVPRIGDVEAACAFSEHLLSKLVQKIHPARLAHLCELARSVGEGEEDEVSRQILKSIRLPNDAGDLSFRINRRRHFETVPDLEMNRILQLSSGRAGFAKMQPTEIDPRQFTMIPFVGLKIDVNTAPEYRVPEGRANDTVNEVFEEAAILRAEKFERLL